MMLKLPFVRRVVRNEQGAAVIEMAFALPVLIMLLWMIVQLGLVFRAMSGIQHGLGEGARTATCTQFVAKRLYWSGNSGINNFTKNCPGMGIRPIVAPLKVRLVA